MEKVLVIDDGAAAGGPPLAMALALTREGSSRHHLLAGPRMIRLEALEASGGKMIDGDASGARIDSLA